MSGEISVLFVCLGNICRSPTAHGVFEKMVQDAGLQDRIRIDSAGTGAWHVGESPDKRATAAAAQRGYRLDHLRARQATAGDFSRFDYVLAMDRSNYGDLESIRQEGSSARLQLFLEYAARFDEREVPDPYYGGADGFDHVLDLVEDAAAGLLSHIRERHL
ncbi:low molecular weight protein-tyrosine-phosphatase [Mangrovitalea sediminis]|uniref:low molecular weight protein-tyrosine-phosphatase n=1 Tax=Mangrovitalea sediminis TaxID=1982043 RepID=UPI000BE58EA5|nr:low molecular weight protein-tyrosine-phosphatase [Mangrovitalea sediminis]